MKMLKFGFPVVFKGKGCGAVVVVTPTDRPTHTLSYQNRCERRDKLSDIFLNNLVPAIEVDLRCKLDFRFFGFPRKAAQVEFECLLDKPDKIGDSSALFLLRALAYFSQEPNAGTVSWQRDVLLATGGVSKDHSILAIQSEDLAEKIAYIKQMPEVAGLCVHGDTKIRALSERLDDSIKLIGVTAPGEYLQKLGFEKTPIVSARDPVRPEVLRVTNDGGFGKILVDSLQSAPGIDCRAATKAIELLSGELAESVKLKGILDRGVSDFLLQRDIAIGKTKIWGEASDRQHLLISGDTGTGKTAVVELLILRELLVRKRMAWYLAPTRALAGEFHRRFLERYGRWIADARQIECVSYNPNDKVVLSTGDPDETQHDHAIRSGSVWLACVVFEKASSLMANMNLVDWAHGNTVGLLVIDELHMIADRQRGGVVDMLLAKALASGESRSGDKRQVQRIVAVTTDAHGEKLAGIMGMHHVSSGKRAISPQVLVSLKRPQDKPLHMVDVAGYRDDKDKFLRDLADVATVDESFIGSAWAPKNAGQNSRYLIDLLSHVLKSHQPGTVLAFVPSQDEIYSLAAQAANLGLFRASAETVAEATAILDRTDLRSELKKELLKFARAGVFVHNAELPRAWKYFVESKFSEPLPQSETTLLLATETLSYGVNLCIDVVILLDVLFPRTIESRPEVLRLALEPNAFWNMIGRVGRPGLSRSSVVYVCAGGSTRKGRARSYVEFSALMEYYWGGQERGLRSSLLRQKLVSPIFVTDRAQELSDLEVAGDSRGRHSVGNLYSYSVFRAVCDGLRFLGKWDDPTFDCTCASMVRLFRENTFYGRSLPKEDELSLLTVVETMIASHSGVGEVFFSGTAQAWAPTVKALALIDNGVHPSAIQSIRAALEQVSRCSEWSGSIAESCLVAGFVCSPEFWNLAAVDLVQEADIGQQDLVGGACRPYLEYAKEKLLALVKRTTVDVNTNDGVLAVPVESLWDEIFDASVNSANKLSYINHTFSPERGKLIFYKLMWIVLEWMDGKREDKLLGIYFRRRRGQLTEPRPSAKAPRAFPPKISEKLAWLANATSSYFEEDSRLLPIRLRFFVASVSARLSYGLPAALIGFRGFGKDAQSRSAVLTASAEGKLGEGWAQKNLQEFSLRKVRELILIPLAGEAAQVELANSVFGGDGRICIDRLFSYLQHLEKRNDEIALCMQNRSSLKLVINEYVVVVAFGPDAEDTDDPGLHVLLTCGDNLTDVGNSINPAVGICIVGLLLRDFIFPADVFQLVGSKRLTLRALIERASEGLESVPFLMRGLVQYPIFDAP